MSEQHGYWPFYGYKHYVNHPMEHPAHVYSGPPHYPPLAPAHLSHPRPAHDVYSYPHPYQRFEQPHSAPAHCIHHHHHHYHNNHDSHTLHIRMITVSKDITKVHWIWHITDAGGTLIKSTTKIHETFSECIADIDGQVEVKILSEHEDVDNKTWIWRISDHTGRIVKTSMVIHKTMDKCVEDVRLHGQSSSTAA